MHLIRVVLAVCLAAFAFGSALASETLNFTIYNSDNSVASSGTFELGSLSDSMEIKPTLISAGSSSFSPTDVRSDPDSVTWFNDDGSSFYISSSDVVTNYQNSLVWSSLAGKRYTFAGSSFMEAGLVVYSVSDGSIAFSSVPEINGATLPKLMALLGMLYLIARSRWKPEASGVSHPYSDLKNEIDLAGAEASPPSATRGQMYAPRSNVSGHERGGIRSIAPYIRRQTRLRNRALQRIKKRK